MSLLCTCVKKSVIIIHFSVNIVYKVTNIYAVSQTIYFREKSEDLHNLLTSYI